MDLPIGRISTSKMEYATGRKQLSVFGSVTWRGLVTGGVEKQIVLMVSDVLDHDAEATCVMVLLIVNFLFLNQWCSIISIIIGRCSAAPVPSHGLWYNSSVE